MPHAAIRRRPLALAIAALLAFPAVESLAQANLKEVLVTATRSSQGVDLLPGTVTTVGRAEIERRQANDIADVFRDEPDVAVTSDMRRFGSGTINIRGIEDNRVLLLVDGVRAADYRSAGSTNYDAANRDLPDPDFLKRVEIVRGPSSSLHGSDAIGGVVGFITLEPEDFLAAGKTSDFGAKLSHSTENQGTKLTAWAALAGSAAKALVMVSRLSAKETETRGDHAVNGFTRTAANPQDIEATSLLAKLAFAPAAGHEIRFGLELKDKRTDSDIQRVANMSGTSLSRISQNLGRDDMERQRLTLDYIRTPAAATWYDRLALKLYWQNQESNDNNFQRRANASLNAAWGCSASTAGTANCNVDQHFDFQQTQLGASLVQEKALPGAHPQFLIWGADWLRTTTEETKNTAWTNLATGATSNQFLGESFPKREYPKGDMDQIGLFVQDEIHLADGRLRLTPGLRYDRFKLSPEQDALYRPVAGVGAAGKSGGRLSPKFAASFEFVPRWHGYAQYVEGYRAPSYEQVNRYFLNNQSFYGIVGNPGLKPETSKGTEIGIKAGDQEFGGQVAVFRNTYRDFIDYVRLVAGDPASLPAPYTITYQYRNLSNVAIHGHEVRGHWQATPSLRFSAAYAYAWGRYESGTAPGTFLPLNSVEPRRLSLAALWTPDAAWGIETRLRAARGQDRVDDSGGSLYRPGGHAVVDLSGWWQLRPDTRLNLAVGNLFDRKYWLWSDVRKAGLPATDPAPDFYTQPGRNLSLSLQVRF